MKILFCYYLVHERLCDPRLLLSDLDKKDQTLSLALSNQIFMSHPLHISSSVTRRTCSKFPPRISVTPICKIPSPHILKPRTV